MCPEDVNEVRSDDADEPDELLFFRCNFLTTSRFAFAATRFFKRVFEKLTQRSTQGRASGNFTWSIQVLILIAHKPLAADTMPWQPSVIMQDGRATATLRQNLSETRLQRQA